MAERRPENRHVEDVATEALIDPMYNYDVHLGGLRGVKAYQTWSVKPVDS